MNPNFLVFSAALIILGVIAFSLGVVWQIPAAVVAVYFIYAALPRKRKRATSSRW